MFSSGRRNAFVAIRRHAWRNFPAETDAARIYTARNDATRPRRRERHARRGTCTRQLATDVWPDAPENRALLPLRQRTASRAPAWCHEGRGNGNVFSVPPGPGRARVTDAAHRRCPAVSRHRNCSLPMGVPTAPPSGCGRHICVHQPLSEQKSCPAIDPILRLPNRRAMPPRRRSGPAIQRRRGCRTTRRPVPRGAASCNPRPLPRPSAPHRTFIRRRRTRHPRRPRPAAIRCRRSPCVSTSTGARTHCSSNRASRCSTHCANTPGSRARRRAAIAGSAARARCSSTGGASTHA